MHVYALTCPHIMVVHVHSCTQRQLRVVHHLSIRFGRSTSGQSPESSDSIVTSWLFYNEGN